MQILTWPSDAAVPIGEFGSQAAAAFPLASGSGEAHAYVVFLAPGGVIGPHPAGFGQLFVPLAGTGWVAGADGARRQVGPGQAACIARGEVHSKGSDRGLTALMVQVRDLVALAAAAQPHH